MNKRTKILTFMLLMAGLTAVMMVVGGQTAVAQEKEDTPLRVTVKDIPPFVIDHETHYTGFSIDI